MHGTPLSILEECYEAILLVGQFYFQCTIDIDLIFEIDDRIEQELNENEKNRLVFLSKF